jgi:hypothetical protein
MDGEDNYLGSITEVLPKNSSHISLAKLVTTEFEKECYTNTQYKSRE